MKKRITMSVMGVVLCAISVAFFKYAALGMDSFQVFVNGMLEVIPISYGNLYVFVNIALLLFAFIFDRHYIGLATLINLFFLGYIAELVSNLEPSCLVFSCTILEARVLKESGHWSV